LCAGKACTADGQLSRVVTPDTLAMFAPGTVRITTEPSFREIYIGTLRHYIPPDYTSSVTFSVRAIESVRQICHFVDHHQILSTKVVTKDDNTHTHPFNGPLSRTTRVSRYQKGKTNLDFTEARDSEWQWHQLGHMQVCVSLQTDNHASTPPLSFLQAGCPSCCPTNSVKALRAYCKR